MTFTCPFLPYPTRGPSEPKLVLFTQKRLVVLWQISSLGSFYSFQIVKQVTAKQQISHKSSLMLLPHYWQRSQVYQISWWRSWVETILFVYPASSYSVFIPNQGNQIKSKKGWKPVRQGEKSWGKLPIQDFLSMHDFLRSSCVFPRNPEEK